MKEVVHQATPQVFKPEGGQMSPTPSISFRKKVKVAEGVNSSGVEKHRPIKLKKEGGGKSIDDIMSSRSMKKERIRIKMIKE